MCCFFLWFYERNIPTQPFPFFFVGAIVTDSEKPETFEGGNWFSDAIVWLLLLHITLIIVEGIGIT